MADILKALGSGAAKGALAGALTSALFDRNKGVAGIASGALGGILPGAIAGGLGAMASGKPGSVGTDFAKAFTGSDHFRDYQHGSKTFVADNYALSPRQKFLFHVVFNLNTGEIPQLAKVFNGKQSTISLLVKSAQLPVYQVAVDELNQYNRKRLIQTKITYQPIQITFHDDGSDVTRSLWYNYFSYYYKDPSHGYNTGTRSNINARDLYDDRRNVSDWGFSGDSFVQGGPKPAFFKDITIYGFDKKKYASYVLVNPIITDWQSDNYDYSGSSDLISSTMTVRYETVKYYAGLVSDGAATGFGDPSHYDTTPSALSQGGTSANILGQGGLLHAGASIMSDLEDGSIGGLLRAAKTAGTAANTFKGKDFGSMLKSEGTGFLSDTLMETLKGNTTGSILNKQVSSLPGLGGFSFPTNLASDVNSTMSSLGSAKPVDLFTLGKTATAPTSATPVSAAPRSIGQPFTQKSVKDYTAADWAAAESRIAARTTRVPTLSAATLAASTGSSK